MVLMNDVIKILNEYADKCTANVLNSNSDIYFNLYGEFLKPRSRSLYIDETHLSLHGMDRIAKVIFRALKAWITFQGGRAKNAKDEAENKQISIPVIHFKNSSVEQEPQDELASYIDGLKHYQVDESCINGAIVMNCNPFTLGHQYLIRRASEQVDFLYVFVVEEDKSAFSFENRIKLVKSGTSGISNVIVLPSGAFIISTLTFPEYFRKDSLTEIIIDPSMDIEIFASKIAPALNIKKRFAGNEPFDRITKQYNQAMKDILPKYGVEFLELDRYETHGAPISASRVRKLLETSQWDEISELVPNTTFEFLRAVYARN